MGDATSSYSECAQALRSSTVLETRDTRSPTYGFSFSKADGPRSPSTVGRSSHDSIDSLLLQVSSLHHSPHSPPPLVVRPGLLTQAFSPKGGAAALRGRRPFQDWAPAAEEDPAAEGEPAAEDPPFQEWAPAGEQKPAAVPRTPLAPGAAPFVPRPPALAPPAPAAPGEPPLCRCGAHCDLRTLHFRRDRETEWHDFTTLQPGPQAWFCARGRCATYAVAHREGSAPGSALRSLPLCYHAWPCDVVTAADGRQRHECPLSAGVERDLTHRSCRVVTPAPWAPRGGGSDRSDYTRDV